MSSSHAPEDFPNINFLTTPEVPYNPEKIAENVLWPLVNAKWDGDFRTESTPSMPPFVFPKEGQYKGKQLEVTLEAICDIDSEEIKGETGSVEVQTTTCEVTITVEESTPEILANLIGMIEEKDPEQLKHWLEPGDDGETLEHELVARSGISYVFCENGDYSILPYRSLQDLGGYEIWRSTEDGLQDEHGETVTEEDTEVDEYNQEVANHPVLVAELSSADIDVLVSAVKILKAPQKVVDYLNRIKAYPEDQ